MRRSLSARAAAYWAAPILALGPAWFVHGQAPGSVYPGQPYSSPAYAASTYAPQSHTGQPYAAPSSMQPHYGSQSYPAQTPNYAATAQTHPASAQTYPAQTYPAQAYPAQAYPAQTDGGQATSAQPAASQPSPRPQFSASPSSTYPVQTAPQTPANQPAQGYRWPMYTAKAEPQMEAAQPTPENVSSAPQMNGQFQMNGQPQPTAEGQFGYDAASAYGYPAPGCNCSPAWSQYGADPQAYGACGTNPGDGCYTPAYCGQSMGCAPPILWEVYGGALLMWRDNDNAYFYSYDSAIESNQYLDSRDAQERFLPGFEVGLVRFDSCCQTGWEALYWGLFPGDETASVYSTDVTGNLDPILDYSQLDYNGSSADNFTDAAHVHRLERSTEIHNAELNRLWGIPGYGVGYTPWSVRMLAGFRYFRLEDNLIFGADASDAVFDGDANELYYTIDTENNLYGAQLGAIMERRTAGKWSFNAGVKAGVFGNDASSRSWIGGSAGTATINNGPFNGQAWLVDTDKGDIAFLGEAKVGVGYAVAPQWRLLCDYRVIGVSGVALPTNQIYPDLRGINDVALLKTNGSLFLQGIFLGAERLF